MTFPVGQDACRLITVKERPLLRSLRPEKCPEALKSTKHDNINRQFLIITLAYYYAEGTRGHQGSAKVKNYFSSIVRFRFSMYSEMCRSRDIRIRFRLWPVCIILRILDKILNKGCLKNVQFLKEKDNKSVQQ